MLPALLLLQAPAPADAAPSPNQAQQAPAAHASAPAPAPPIAPAPNRYAAPSYPASPYPPPGPPHAPAPAPAEAAGKRAEPPSVRWLARGAIGAGTLAPSEQTRLLRHLGYGAGYKYWFTLDASYLVTRHVGVGAFAGLSLGGASMRHVAGPKVSETVYFGGAQVPVLIGTRNLAGQLSLRLGYGGGSQDMGGDGEGQSSVAVGVEAVVTSITTHLYGGMGFLGIHVGPPGDVGRDHNLGGLYFLVGGVIDG